MNVEFLSSTVADETAFVQYLLGNVMRTKNTSELQRLLSQNCTLLDYMNEFSKVISDREVLALTFSRLNRDALAVQIWTMHMNRQLITQGMIGDNFMEQRHYDVLRNILLKRLNEKKGKNIKLTGEVGSLLTTTPDP